jgi:hypothetical protein
MILVTISYSQNSGIHLEEITGDAILKLEADLDDGNKNDNPRIEFIHDGGYPNSSIGLNIFENGEDNGLFIANNTSARVGIFFATNNLPTGWSDAVIRMTIKTTGEIGIGTEDPNSKLQITNGDIYIEDINKGIIMKAPNGSCFRYTSNNAGNLTGTAITCPN